MKIGLNMLEYYVFYYFYYYLVIYQTYSMILIFIYNSHFRQLKTLSFATANTNQIALGTCVIEMLFHDPVILARRFATLDVLSQDKVF
jgi:alkanesulfonate monooxygenase SsuD/methylene tetrahydromethanopterin reductase-like flavin-dependent oxidoreductase (luciferase family)